MRNPISNKSILYFTIYCVFLMILTIEVPFAQQTDIKRELKRLNAKIDRERVRTDSLETQISILLPDLRNTLRATVDAKNRLILLRFYL